MLECFIDKELESISISEFDLESHSLKENNRVRLGHFMEEIFAKKLEQLYPNESILHGIQIIEDKITLGELDFVIYNDDTIKHIEFCYKIYLLDSSLSSSEFECWIGPNRRDSLKQKSTKLLEKQLPLLYHPATNQVLSKLISNYDCLVKNQSVCYIKQLYVPLKSYKNNAIYDQGTPEGFYIHSEELKNFKEYKWKILSTKLDWVLQPKTNTDWINTTQLAEQLKPFYNKDSNPLCWMKDPKGNLYKCFVVNWNITR